MSRRNQDLVSRVRFEVDSRMANATMQALQTHAEKLNQQVTEVNASIKALGDVPDDNPALLEYRKQLRRLNSDLKDVNTTMKDYTRGVKAAGELYRHYAMGNIEDMSIKAIRAGVNGMKKRYDNLKAGGDPGDAEEMRLIEAITNEADVVVKRFKTDYQHVVEEIARGGTVTEQTLKRTRDGLADLMQTAETEAEKNELTNYWQKVGAAIEAVAVENRRLRGEVADREEAMRIAYATDHDGSQQSIHDAEARADAARRENDELRQRLDLKQQQRRELEQEMDINSMQQRSLMDRRDELKAQEKEDRAIRNQRVDDANKELNAARRAAKTQQQAYDEQKQTVEKLRTEVQGLTDDIRKMGEVKAEPKIDTSDIEGLKKKIESTIDELGTLEQQWDDKIADYIFEKYPTQATVSAKTKSPEGLKEREAMKKDTVLAQMKKQREQELNAVDERLTSLIRKEREWTEAQQQSTAAQQQSAQSSEQLAQKQEQLSQKTAELNQQQDKLNGMVDETVTTNQRLARAEQEQTDARNAQAEAKKHEGEAVKKVEDELRGLTDEQQKNAQAYSHLTEEINADTAAMQRNITTEQEATREADRLRSGSIDKMEQALARLRESNRKLDPTIDKEEWERGERAIGQLNLRLEELKKQSAELRREPVLDMMTQRMQSLGTLSRDALTETKKFWQAMYDGADNDADKLREIEDNLKRINTEEQKRDRKTLEERAARLQQVDNYSVGELREGIDAAKRLQDQYHLTDDELQQLSVNIVAAETRIAKVGVEAERQAQKQREQIALMEQQLANGSALTESALKAQVNYWQRLADDPKAAAEAVAQYTANMKQAQDLLDQSQRADIESKAGRLQNLGAYSISEIREGIDAAKKMQDTFHLTDAAVQKLSEDIVAAEKHVSQFSVETERAAQKQRESVTTMSVQLRQGLSLSESALKAQVSYWRKLIDDPKTAAENLELYKKNLEQAEGLLKGVASIDIDRKGEEALKFFRGNTENASASLIRDYAKDLKAYRDSLPSKDKADVIAEIDGYLKAAGVSAKKAAEDVMDLKDALDLAEKAGDSKQPFNYGAQEIQAATKALELRREELIKQIRAERDLGNAVDAQEKELDDLTKKLRSLKFEQDNVNMSQEKMRTLIETPANAVNLDELRAAIKRADGQLRQMQDSLGQNSDEYKRFAEQVRQAKNVMKEMEGQAKASATAWEKAFSRLKTYVVMYMGFNEVWQKVSNTARDLMDLSDRMGEVRKTTGFTADEVGRLSENLKKMDVRTSLTSLMELSASSGQLGLKTLEDVQGFTEAANKLMIALPEMGREAATEMMRVAIATGEVDKIRKQLQESTIEGSSATAVAMEKIASTIDRLRATSASTAPEITDFVKRVGAVGAQSGITIDQVAALGSTVSSLGMRIEMSATALSRMIPAIRNNAFELAKAIGVTPDTVRNLFDTGRGMEVILMILQRIKDTGMDADSVEQMLGMAGMRDIMKDLNQQGARAGIVFSGLSQNVDELRKQLETASDAYEENVAIQQEFDKMNETTAAKWERLKNEFEEMWVGDQMQRSLGWLIDRMRDLVNVLSGNVEPAFKSLNIAVWTLGAYFFTLKSNIGNLVVGAFGMLIKGLTAVKTAFVAVTTTKGLKSMKESIWLLADETKKYIALKWQLVRAHDADEKAAIRARLANNALAKSMSAFKANVVMAVIAAIGVLIYKMHEWNEKSKEAAREAAQFQAELDKETAKVDKLFNSVGKATVKMQDANKEVEEARKALKKAQEQVDGSKESADRLAEAESNLAEKEENLKNKQATHAKTIEDINSMYGQYLGFMLSEVSTAQELANARDMINDKLRETITLKRKEAAMERVEKAEGEERDERYADLYNTVTRNSYTKVGKGRLSRDATLAATLMRDITDMAQEDYDDPKKFRQAVMQMLTGGQYKGNVGDITKIADEATDYYEQLAKIRKKNNDIEKQWAGEDAANRKRSQGRLETQYKEATKNYRKLELDYRKAEGDAKKEAAVKLLKEMDTITEMVESSERHFETDPGKGYTVRDKNGKVIGTEKGRFDRFIKDSAGSIDQMKKQREALLKEAGNLYQARKKVDGEMTTSIKPVNPWGTSERADSTTYTEMTAEQLVNRRDQMNKFVNSLQTDTDVKAVLNEDKALKKAIEAGMSSDMRTVIEWYNTERLKIQDELHARHLTNTGDWLDPKKERMRKKQLQDEWNMYLREIDAYYTERKTRIEEAGTDDGLTEAEIRNRTLANEMEWRQRRAELQKLYADKSVEVTAEEQQAIFDIISERTGDDVKYVKAQIASTVKFMKDIGKMSEKELKEALSKLGLGWERDFLKQQQAVTQQMKAIQDIIDKERPFNGITKQLRESLATMDILTGDMRERYKKLLKTGTDEEKKRFNEEQNREELRRTSFLLGEAEQAYSTTIDRVMQQMREKGMTAWADWLSIRPEQQEALMAQLRQTYDAIQDAIKKEASQLKKQAEIMWNNILVPGGDGKTTMKQMLDRTVAQLGIEQGRVSRANSLIGAGASSERVADKLAIQQMRLQLTMQEHYYNLMKKQGRAHVDMLNQQADAAERRGNAEEATRKRLDAQHAEMALNLATAKEETELAKQREEIIARTEESQNRLYTSLREWADLLTSSLQGVFEASHAGDAEYYNERAKLNLTGKGGPGAGTYVVIDDAGTSDATAHYEYLDERQALERQHEIEVQNAQAEAWRKLMDDLNMKMSEQITDWMNAYLQNKATEDNTAELQRLQQKLEAEQQKMDASVTATDANTQAVQGLTQQLAEGITIKQDGTQPGATGGSDFAADKQAGYPSGGGELSPAAQQQINEQNAVTENFISNKQKEVTTETQTDKKIASSNASTFAKMTQAVNLYGVAYQAMSNDNLDMAQKFEMIALQAVGNAAIAGLQVLLSDTTAKTAANKAATLSKDTAEHGSILGPILFAVSSALIGGLMGMAASRIAKSKSEIAQATGASVGAGRLAMGMLTYKKGNVNELTDPASLTPGRQYNVDGADGKTYRARYMGKGAKTHITNGPEFHLVGEAGREAIIDAKTTRLLQLNETGIWRDIQTLYNGGSISGLSTRRRRGGVRAFADGNIGEFEDAIGGDAIAENGTGGMGMEQMLTALDRNSAIQEALLERLNQPIFARNIWTGPEGIPNMYNKMQKEAQRHGEKYL